MEMLFIRMKKIKLQVVCGYVGEWTGEAPACSGTLNLHCLPDTQES